MSPLYVQFATGRGYYVYDSITNRVLRVGQDLYHALDYCLGEPPQEQVPSYGQRAVTDLGEARRTIDTLRSNYGLFAVQSLKERGTVFTEEGVRDAFAHKGISGCSLELTEQCNFRCKYCAYSGGYTNQRTHGHRTMSWPIAQAAIDLYLGMNQGTDPSGHFGIGFYGGEPFMRFALLRKVMEYTKLHPLAEGRNIFFHATTNGSLLTDDMLAYLQANDFGLLVSLDGPREHHDRNRVLRDDSPTFDVIMQRARHIQSMYPDYFKRCVSFSVVLAPESNLLDLDRFFTEDDLFGEDHMSVRSGNVASGHAAYTAQHPAYPERSRDLAELQAKFFASHVNGTVCSQFVRQLFEGPYLRIYKRPILGPSEISMPAPLPVCIPGQRKLYIACDGTLHMCEKIGTHPPIGHVTTGIDFGVVAGLLNRYRDAANGEECRSCWAHRFCASCFVKVGVGDDGSFTLDAHDCEVTRKSLLGILTTYCRVTELNPQAWDYMDRYLLS